MNPDGSGQTNLTNTPGMDEAVDPWSPDGKKVAIASEIDGQKDIFILNADGSGQVRLTDTPYSEWATHWSPDGKQIAFLANRDGVTDIYAMNADGSDVRRLTESPEGEGYLSWLQDGTKILFTSIPQTKGSSSDIYVLDLQTLERTCLACGTGNNYAPEWAP